MPIAHLSACAGDVRVALRSLVRAPRTAAVALLTLTLGLAAPAAIFSVVHAVLIAPLPYPDPERIVRLRLEAQTPDGPASIDGVPVMPAMAWAAGGRTLDLLALFQERALTLSTPEGPERLTGIAATPNLFEVLRTPPRLGRTFRAAADAREIVLADSTWRRYFGGRADVVGTVVTFDGGPHRVAGVMPPGFGFPTPEAAFWMSVPLAAGGGRGMLLPAVARLRADATLVEAVEEGRLFLQEAGGRARHTLQATTLHAQLVGDVARLLWILLGAVGFVSLVATANVALLLLVRGAARAREFSIRLAIGASRWRLLRQLTIEAATLVALGGAAAVLFAHVLLRAVVALAPPDMPRLQEATINGPVLLFSAALTLCTSLVVGVLSAARTVAINPVRALGSGTEGPLLGSRVPRRRLNRLAAAELAMTMVLLVAAALLLQSLGRLMRVDQGFEPGSALAFQVSLPSSRYPTAAARLAFHERLLERLRGAGELAAAGLIVTMPNRQPSARFDFNPRELPAFRDPESMQVAEVRHATEGFLEAMGVPLVAGRTFNRDDVEGAEPVMVISESLARLHFKDEDPVGRLLYSGSGTRRVIGVVGDVRPADDRPMVAPSAYVPLRQDADVLEWFGTATVVVRGAAPATLARSMRSLILSMDPEMPPFNVRALEDEVASLAAGPRFSATALGVFATVALVMAGVGVYGVMSYAAAARTREIGVRIALGATPARVFATVLREGVGVLIGGLAAGTLAALWLTQSLAGLLYEVQPADAFAFSGVAAVLSAATLLAICLPALRATKISAVEAMKN